MQITHETLREQGCPGGLVEEAEQNQGFQAGNAGWQRQGIEPEWSRRRQEQTRAGSERLHPHRRTVETLSRCQALGEKNGIK